MLNSLVIFKSVISADDTFLEYELGMKELTLLEAAGNMALHVLFSVYYCLFITCVSLEGNKPSLTILMISLGNKHVLENIRRRNVNQNSTYQSPSNVLQMHDSF